MLSTSVKNSRQSSNRFQTSGEDTNIDGQIPFMFADEAGDMFMMVLGCANMIMGISSRSNLLKRRSHKFMLDVMNASLAPLYLSHLLDKILPIRSRVPCFGTVMFKFTLYSSISGSKLHSVLNELTVVML